jgi:pyridinium-3,5-bisthiocarboxylic acid mononucleotide nickel chelatase
MLVEWQETTGDHALRVLHFDCFNGISGDMVLGALLHAGVPRSVFDDLYASLKLPIRLEVDSIRRSGIACIQANIVAEDQESYRFLPDVESIITSSTLTQNAKAMASAIFRKLAEAEATVHAMPVEKVHFHEVGALDSIADILGAAAGFEFLGIEKFTSSSVPTGHGTVKCDHGVMPIPAPATAVLLQGVPLAKVDVRAELTTPTGAAILKTVVTEFTETPTMTIEKIGIGTGTKDFMERPNILRLLLGESQTNPMVDEVLLLETNLDDVPAEIIGYTTEKLFAAGALDVFVIPIQMKKQRPGMLLSVLTEPQDSPKMEEILFRETGTFGIRRTTHTRTKLDRHFGTVESPWGPVQVKIGERGGHRIVTVEYEEAARIASTHDLPLREVYATIQSLKPAS